MDKTIYQEVCFYLFGIFFIYFENSVDYKTKLNTMQIFTEYITISFEIQFGFIFFKIMFELN